MSSDQKEDGKRLAIIVGIDEYEGGNDKIQKLYGAQNDAKELREILTNRGRFEISSNHFLTGKNATYKAIVKAVSEVFRQDNKCSLVIFYFSGHGIPYGEKEGYIAPYDMDPTDPFVCGISMENLRQVIYQSNIPSVLVILDCCYAGIAAENTKGSGSDPKMKNLYAQQTKQIIALPISEDDKDRPISSERGKIILASSEADQPSREKDDCKHFDDDKFHTHGQFTFHLIEGLSGKAADSDTGLITIEKLRDYIEENMNSGKTNEQKLIYNVSGASEVRNIRIAVAEWQFNSKTKNLISEADKFLKATTSLPDIQSLEQAAKTVYKLRELDPKNKEIDRLIKDIDDAITKQKDRLTEWLTANMLALRLSINAIRSSLYRDFFSFVQNLDYDRLQTIDESTLLYLIYLNEEADKITQYGKNDKESIEQFVKRISAATKFGGE